ncbi:TetR/AcrR family transcriptional regulator [Fontisphaera persica]|uniref:TetR/AcrR family transcriptional regulator n=1 Tax=Fontisphaera persica TaxID=2974023 RepID=UPI0024C08F88|nr:TetR/AcrR family transcriptional regulator [Fontisphaera persica]WCJ58979.1 TetR/AcrR family transcriptional regulator [Fontisphaera persica]
MVKSSPQRERRRVALREQILEAARDLFVSRGYEAVTMRELADRIGYTATALYYHFPDKASLLHELCRRDFLALQSFFQKLAQVKDPVERLRQAGLAYVRFGLEHPQHYRFMFMTPYPEPAPHEVDIAQGDPSQDSYAFLRQAVEEAIQAGRFLPQYRDAEQVAQMLWAAMHGLVALHLSCRDSRWLSWRPTRRTAELMAETMLRGMLREPAGLARPRGRTVAAGSSSQRKRKADEKA